MNAADIVILSILIISMVIGLVRGLVLELLEILVWLAAVFAAIMFGDTASAWFASAVSVPSAQLALGYASIFFGVVLIGALCKYLFKKAFESTGMDATDRMLGMAFGLLRGSLLVVALVIIAGLTPLPRDPWWQQSQTLPAFEKMASVVSTWLPESIREYLNFDPQQSELLESLKKPASEPV